MDDNPVAFMCMCFRLQWLFTYAIWEVFGFLHMLILCLHWMVILPPIWARLWGECMVGRRIGWKRERTSHLPSYDEAKKTEVAKLLCFHRCLSEFRELLVKSIQWKIPMMLTLGPCQVLCYSKVVLCNEFLICRCYKWFLVSCPVCGLSEFIL